MDQKTIRLDGGDYRINNGIVEVFVQNNEFDFETYDEYLENPGEWKPSKYKLGAEVMLVSSEDVSPDALRSGTGKRQFDVRFDRPDGIGGNSNPDIKRYHGWRGTTGDISCHAHGLRKITKIRQLKNGDIAVTVGKDLYPEAN